MFSSISSAILRDRLRGMLWGIFIGDALSMPVHWYYNPSDIDAQYGRITAYLAPSDFHPSSIMSVANTGGAGRGDQRGNVIGGIILHDKKQYWGKRNVHYHRGMQAGENTLNSLCARELMNTITEHKGYDRNEWLGAYVKFMTTPGTHNDTYAESFHRDFFANYAAGKAPDKCAGDEGHDTPSIGAFVQLPVVIAACIHDGLGRADIKKKVVEHMYTTHKSASLVRPAEAFTDLILDALEGRDLRESVSSAAKQAELRDIEGTWGQPERRVIGGKFTSACYISGSFPSVLYLAGSHAASFEDAVVANTNAGGENVHRGSAIGAVMGAALGESKIPQRFIKGLAAYHQLESDITSFVDWIVPNDCQA